MKITIKNSALLAAALVSLGATSSSVFAATASTAGSTGKIQFLENDGPTKPVDPNDPNKPGKDPNDPNKPIDPDDPDNGGTDNDGPLSLDYVSNIDFGRAKINQKTVEFLAKNDNPFVQVTDSREKGSWSLTAALTKEFTNTTNGSFLKGAVMHWKNGEAKSTDGNSSVAPTITNKDVQLKDNSQVEFMSATEAATTPVTSTGKGTWVDRFLKSGAQAGEQTEDLGDNANVTLEVPSNSAQAGTYTGEITWTLSDVAK